MAFLGPMIMKLRLIGVRCRLCDARWNDVVHSKTSFPLICGECAEVAGVFDRLIENINVRCVPMNGKAKK